MESRKPLKLTRKGQTSPHDADAKVESQMTDMIAPTEGLNQGQARSSTNSSYSGWLEDRQELIQLCAVLMA